MNTTPETMTKHDFSDLTPPDDLISGWQVSATGTQLKIDDRIRAFATDVAHWGAEQAAERLVNQWPTPITDRAPTEADADEFGYVMAVDAQGYWHMRSRYATVEYNLPWAHSPRWQPPAPPTLKEQALKVLKPPIPVQLHDGSRILKPHEIDLLLRALESDS